MDPTASRDTGPRPQSADFAAASVSSPAVERVLEESLYRVRATVQERGEKTAVSQLIVETKHPLFPPEQCPVFNLTPLLEHASRLSPRTVSQVVDPSSSDAIRREALQTLVFSLSQSPASANAVQKPVVRDEASLRSQSLSCGDELEPTFSITARPATTFHDLILGVCTKEVVALRNDQAVVRFEVSQGVSHLEHAIIQAVPVRLNWPLLDTEGEDVTLRTVDQAIFDFSTILYGMRAAKWGVALKAVAEELERRQEIKRDGEPWSPTDSFLLSLLAFTPDEQLQPAGEALAPVALALAPEGRDLQPRDLDDGRIVWLGMERSGPGVSSSRLVLAGFSSSGAEYRVEVSVPFIARGRLSAIHRELLDTRDHERFSNLLDRAVRLPGARGLCLFDPDLANVPGSINSLLRSAGSENPTLQIECGGWPERFSLFYPIEQARILSVVKGLTPFRASRIGASPARSWRFEAALDESLSGVFLAANRLGDRVQVSLRPDGASVKERSEFLQQCMTHGSAPAEEFIAMLMQAPGGRVSVERSAAPATLRVLDAVALKWQQALIRSGQLRDLSFAEAISWWVEELPRGRCSLSILPGQDRRFSWEARHAIVVGPKGIEAGYLSVGNRSFLGFLRGASVTMGEGQVPFSTQEEDALLRVLSSREAATSQDAAEELLLSALPHVELKRRVGMRRQDPFRDDKDLLQIAYNWMERIFGS